MKIDKNIYKVEFTRGTGAGGQHRNKVETCVVITHLPTGKKEKCEDTRYKNKNLETAYKRLVAKVNEEEKKIKHELANDKKVELLKNNGVVRTYNFPRNEVKDHRSGKIANLEKVLNGKLDLIKK